MAQASEKVRWFKEEVHPHDSQLKGYLRGAFPSVRDIDDLVQESYLRIWKARAAVPIRSARAFLFTIARRLALDTIRRDRSVRHEIVTDLHTLSVLEPEAGVFETVSARQEIALLAEAIDSLPIRCREIVSLRKLDGLSHREIAALLGISEETVQVQLGRGMHKIARFLRSQGIRNTTDGEKRFGAP